MVSWPLLRGRGRGLHSPVIRQHENYSMLSLLGRDEPQRNSSAGEPVRETAKRNAPETSRHDRAKVNRDGPARSTARRTGTPVESDQTDTNREETVFHLLI